jgi:predicted membrane protein
MALNTSSRGILGLGLMVVGSLLFVPAMFTGSAPVLNWALVPAILVLTLGTWLVGTDIDGEPV